MTHRESGLPVARPTSQDLAQFDELSRALSQAKNPAEKLKIASQALKIGRHYELEGLFEMVFKYASLYCRAEHGVAKEIVSRGRLLKIEKRLKNRIKTAYERVSLEALERGLEECKEKHRIPSREFFKTMGNPFGSGEFEWYTPRWVYERCRHIMGSIDLDPASSPQAVAMGNQAKRIFTQKDNALKQDWGKAGNVFINPPYTLKASEEELAMLDKNKKVKKKDSGARAFLNKLLATDYKQAILLVLEDSGTSYGQTLWDALANCVFIPSGRLHFVYKGQSKEKSTTRSSLIFGVNVDELKFWLAFKDYGSVVTIYRTPQELRTEYLKNKKRLGPWLEALAKLPVSESRIKRKAKDIAKVKSLLKAPLK